MAVIKTVKDALAEARAESERLRAQGDSNEVAASIAFVALAEGGALDDVTTTEHAELFSQWTVGIDYKAGNIRAWQGELYRCIQAHKSQDDWAPDRAPALWVRVGDPAEEWPEWSQPVGAHDAYAKGDKCSCDNKHWISDVDGNVWRPGVYGWNQA